MRAMARRRDGSSSTTRIRPWLGSALLVRSSEMLNGWRCPTRSPLERRAVRRPGGGNYTESRAPTQYALRRMRRCASSALFEHCAHGGKQVQPQRAFGEPPRRFDHFPVVHAYLGTARHVEAEDPDVIPLALPWLRAVEDQCQIFGFRRNADLFGQLTDRSICGLLAPSDVAAR